ncbi:MAG: hypothetical protein JSV55_06040 [Deltaproteobacteria bacterium]|nr:MAG: hypothetical protein JSV55_06040 [Deltaproteobacteria bacterium]
MENYEEYLMAALHDSGLLLRQTFSASKGRYVQKESGIKLSRFLKRRDMLPRQRYSNRLWPALLGLLLVFAFSCGSKARYAGLYEARDSESQKPSETYIELKENGEGVWRVKDEENSFSWYVKGSEIRMNTKAGGIIVAKIQNDTLEITLPAGKKMSFKKVK